MEAPGVSRGLSMSKKPLPLPLGEVARRSRVGEGWGFSKKIPEKLIFAKQISERPSQSCCRMTTACGRSGRGSDSPQDYQSRDCVSLTPKEGAK